MASVLLVYLTSIAALGAGEAVESGITYSVQKSHEGFSLVRRNSNILLLSKMSSHQVDWTDNELAVGMYNATFNKTGWDMLEIHTNPSVADADAAQAAGFFEGKATIAGIENNALNSGIPGSKLSDGLSQFLSANEAYMSSMIDISEYLPRGHPDRRIWYQANLVMQQLKGMYSGYLAARSESSQGWLLSDPLTLQQILLLNLGGDLEDLDGVGTCNISSARKAEGVTPKLGKGHCSALVRLTEDNEDVMIAHDTWSTLNSMLRTYKMYDLPFKMSSDELNASDTVPASSVSFSSYPGVLNSGDDFYVLNTGLIQWETTIGNSNPALSERFISPMSILEWMRNIIANRLATSCVEWPEIYQRFNSGTYNNMNMCFDYNLFTPGSDLKPGSFIIAEQIPGYIRTTDLSAKVQEDRYFGSYNVAYDPFIRQMSGSDLNTQKYGDWFSYNETARAQLFRRDAPKVKDLSGLKRLMRHCEYKTDPLSTQAETCKYLGWTNCTPMQTTENCIATRGDLNPADGVYSISSYGHRNHVSTDTKISQFSTFSKVTLPADIVSGPVGSADNNATPDFVWSTSSYSSLPHYGMPDRMVFPWNHVSF